MTLRFAASLFFVSVFFTSSPVDAQQKEPKRPRLDPQADTNDANAYYRFATERLRKEPDKAADALYWATRLDPAWADAYYARRIALLLADPQRLARYWSGDRRTIESKEIKQIDSLYLRALTINPFVSQMLDRELFDAIIDDISRRYAERTGATPLDVRYALDRQMSSWGPAFRAYMAYGEGRYDDALEYYAKAIKEDKRNGPLHADRGRIFFNKSQLDSALAELTAAIEDMRKRDKKDLVYVYQSKALTEHAIAIVHQRLEKTDAAKEAFGRALQEDLSYYPAHLQLAFMALDAKDTATALTELELATQLRDDDASAQFFHGYTLAMAGKSAAAEPHIKKAMQLNPVYAAPKFVYAFLLETAGFKEEAISMYREFLAAASRNDARRAPAETRVAALLKSEMRDNR
jgi:tetratricopeptide (TPR) repeat protein